LQDEGIKSYLENNLGHYSVLEVLTYFKEEHGVEQEMGLKVINEFYVRHELN
jgi:hypothetical protein